MNNFLLNRKFRKIKQMFIISELLPYSERDREPFSFVLPGRVKNTDNVPRMRTAFSVLLEEHTLSLSDRTYRVFANVWI